MERAKSHEPELLLPVVAAPHASSIYVQPSSPLQVLPDAQALTAAAQAVASRLMASYVDEVCCHDDYVMPPAIVSASKSEESEAEDHTAALTVPASVCNGDPDSIYLHKSPSPDLGYGLQNEHAEDQNHVGSNEAKSDCGENDDKDEPIVSRLQDEGPEHPLLLNEGLITQLAQNAIPSTLTSRRWVRLYSLGRDGDSFGTFLTLAGGARQTVLAVRTDEDCVFGAYVDDPWASTQEKDVGYRPNGSARSCLWRVNGEKQDVEVYEWTGANRYIQLLDKQNGAIAMGGGGNFGLRLEDDFQRGSTGRCATFGNDPLCDGEGCGFKIADVECWGFKPEFD